MFETAKASRTDIRKIQNKSAAPSKAAEVAEEKISFADTLTITAKASMVSDEQFLSAVQKNMLSEVQSGAPEHQIQDLGRQVALGEYEIGVSEVIKKIMLESEI